MPTHPHSGRVVADFIPGHILTDILPELERNFPLRIQQLQQAYYRDQRRRPAEAGIRALNKAVELWEKWERDDYRKLLRINRHHLGIPMTLFSHEMATHWIFQSQQSIDWAKAYFLKESNYAYAVKTFITWVRHHLNRERAIPSVRYIRRDFRLWTMIALRNRFMGTLSGSAFITARNRLADINGYLNAVHNHGQFVPINDGQHG